MGCVASKPEDGALAARPAKATKEEAEAPLIIPEVTWEMTPSYTAKIQELCAMAVRNGREEEFRRLFDGIGPNMAKEWIEEQYPACNRAGTIEPVGPMAMETSYGCSRYPALPIMVLDEHFTGVVYAVVMVVGASLTEEGDTHDWRQPGAALGSPEMEAAARTVLRMLAMMRHDGINVNHSYVHVAMGSDMLTCKFDNTTTAPTINEIPHARENGESRSRYAQMVIAARRDPDHFRGKFNSNLFETTVTGLAEEYPGSTVWDEGELPFSVDGTPYAGPTRLLMAREFSSMAQDVDVAHFQVITPDTKPASKPVVLMRNLSPGHELGGIVGITLLIAVEPHVLWPVAGTYTKSPVRKAAMAALLENVKKLYRMGKVQRCAVRLYIGSDPVSYLFVGERLGKLSTENREINSAARYVSLEGFGVKLKEQKKHELFQSESQFQAVKHYMREKAQQDPERFKAMGPLISTMAATHFLERNFPGCLVTDEGEFPATRPVGKETTICDTRLLVARDPKQAPKDVVAAVYVVPNPGDGEHWMAGPEKTWLESKEMKVAEEALLELLTRWYKEGMISELDCMAQVMMATDVSYYQFVDGERFVDYPDERIEQISWG